MKFNKIVAGVLMVSVVCCLMITYTGRSSGTPPTEQEFLAQSNGLIVTSNKEIVYPDEEGMWMYRLYISPEADSGVLLQRLEMKCYTFRKEYVLDETFDGNDFKDWWGSPYIQAGQTRNFGAGLPSRNNIYYRDHIFIGIDDTGNEVKGTIRIHFSKEKQTTETSVQGPPTEEEFLAQSHGLVVTSDKQTVYPDSENAWRYRLSISAEGDSGVLVQKLEMKYYSFSKEYVLTETFDGNDFKAWWGSPYIQAGQTRNFGAGLSSRSSLYYRDHIFTGIDDDGNKVTGTIRVHFSKEEAPPTTKETEESLPEGVPVEEEFLAQSHGIEVECDKHIVYYEEGGWYYTLRISPIGDVGVNLQEIQEIYCTSRGQYVVVRTHGEDSIRSRRRTNSTHIAPSEIWEFTTGFSLVPGDQLTIEFQDYIFTGIDDDGNEVKGTIRVHFSKEEAPPPSEEKTESLSEGIPTEEQLSNESYGLLITSDKRIVYPENGRWRCTLKISPTGNIGVQLQEIEFRFTHGSITWGQSLGEDIIKRFLGTDTCYIPAGEIREMKMQRSSDHPDSNELIFIGVDDDGNEVKGTIRIYFAESEEELEEETVLPSQSQDIK